MAIDVITPAPKGLLDAIYKAIYAGRVQTWTYDDDGDFIHSTPDRQWIGKAWLRPQIGVGVLNLTIVPPAQQPLSKEAYAVYHGRFIEMLLVHFDGNFAVSSATALQTTAEMALTT